MLAIISAAAGNGGALFISIWSVTEHNRADFLLSPALCLSPAAASMQPRRLWSSEQGRSSGGEGGGGDQKKLTGVTAGERGEATDAAGGEQTGACRRCFGPLTKRRLTRCQDNHGNLRNG